MPKWSKFLWHAGWKHVMFSLLCLQWYKVVSFLLLFNNKISRAGNYYPFILVLVVTLTFLHKEWKKSIQTHKPVFLFWRKTNFFFPMKGEEKKKKKKRNHSKQMFCDSQLLVLTVVVVIIQLYVVSLVASCLCILRVSFCLFLLWLF